jgi:hypothetical protein
MTSAHRLAVIVDSMAVSLHAGVRWLQAGSAEVITLRPKPDTPAPAAERQERTLTVALARWSARIQRCRGLVLVRRHLLVAVCLAIVLQILNLAAGVSELALVAAPCLALAGIAVELPRRPDPAQVAGLLDEQIGLFDLIGTGFELQARGKGAMRPLEERALNSAAAEAAGSLGAWRARSAPARAEWSTLLVGLAALAALLVIAPSHILSGRSAAGRATAQAGSAVSGHRGSAKATASTPAAKAPAPASAPAYHEAAGSTRKGFQTPTQAVSKSSTGSPAKTSGGGTVTSRTAGSPSKQAGAKAAPGAAGQAGSRTGAATGVSPVSAPHLATAAPNGTRAAAGSTPARSRTTSSTSAAGRRTGSAGRPTGASSAGHARGSTRLGGSHTLTGSATKSLPLTAGYAPAPKGSTTASHAGNGPGGGGHARAQEVEGGAGGAGAGADTFVPSDGGAVAAAGSGSLISYLASLQWVQEQPW